MLVWFFCGDKIEVAKNFRAREGDIGETRGVGESFFFSLFVNGRIFVFDSGEERGE